MKVFNPNGIKEHYRSGKDILSRDFFIPCLKASKKYRRAVAYFSTKALLEWVDIIDDILKNNIQIKLLLSPNLSEEDLEALKKLNKEERIEYIREFSEEYFGKLEDYRRKGDLDKWRVNFFSWLIANQILEIKFAFPEGEELGALFHEKIGIFNIDETYKIAFTGSANETSGGYKRNYESIDVYRNWIEAEVSRVETKEKQFDEAWKNSAVGLLVYKLSEKVLNQIKSYSNDFEKTPKKPQVNEPSTDYKGRNTLADTLWDHQKEAFDEFLDKKAGILEMATGTGKTRTAIAIMEHLLKNNKIDGAIVTVEGTDLLKQWQSGLDEWNFSGEFNLKIFGQYSSTHELMKFIRNPENSILILSRHQLQKLFTHKKILQEYSLLIIHDEVHGFGSPSHVENLEGSHKIFDYKLGLSATPERDYDKEGNKFIEDEVGSIIYSFDLADAIKNNILCEFDYETIEYELSENDKQRIQAVYAKYRKKEELGEPFKETDKYRDLAMVYKTAENKVGAFDDLVNESPELLESCILFTATTAYAEEFLPIIHDQTIKYRTYFSDDEEYHLKEFAKGNIDCLVTCHKISQGIDIPSLSTIVLISSDRAKLETIQRIGRSLRKDKNNPKKRATVYDFVGYRNGSMIQADKDRAEWLSKLSKTKAKTDG